jgi:superfamily II DNA or RNA helicase
LRLGREYFEDEHVRIHSSKGSRVLASVKGSRPRPYVVGLDFGDVAMRERLKAGCTCPHAFEGHFCKHIFATLLEIDAAALDMAKTASSCARLDLVPLKEDLIDLETTWFGDLDDAPSVHGDRSTPADWVEMGRSPPPFSYPRPPPPSAALPKTPRARTGDWRAKLASLRRAVETWTFQPMATPPSPEQVVSREIRYVLAIEKSIAEEGLIIELKQRALTKSGALGKMKPFAIAAASLARVADEKDRALLRLLLATPYEEGKGFGAARGAMRHLRHRIQYGASLVPSGCWDILLPALCATGRFEHASRVLSWDDGAPFRFELALVRQGRQGRGFVLRGKLLREGQVRDLEEAQLVLPEGLVVFPGRIARLELASDEEAHWIRFLKKTPGIAIEEHEHESLLGALFEMAHMPRLSLGEDFPWKIAPEPLVPRITFREPGHKSRPVIGKVAFAYGPHEFEVRAEPSGRIDKEQGRVVVRDQERERRELARLYGLGARSRNGAIAGEVEVRSSELVRIVRELVRAGWRVEAHGRRIRSMRSMSMRVSSGVDWFDLSARIDFEGVSVGLPELLRAVKKKTGLIRLDDGSEGVLPEEWIARYAPLVEMGTEDGSAIRFQRSQAILLDLLLASESDVAVDEAFERARTRLGALGKIEPLDAPPSFIGRLRDYQKEGLGWLVFLEELELGGCLADDMGLGKTVQVLALLLRRKAEADRPSLVVAPRSLVHNWISEAARFAPDLSVLDYTGQSRAEGRADFEKADLIVTTYGTVRRDILELEKIPFDYVVLDEAQAIKNHAAQASKACRLLKGRHRLALSGTPVENHVLELHSIFEFLNPKMLGARRTFADLAAPIAHEPGEESLLARALRPLILRRTKEQVLRELPEKTELTIQCELEGEDLRLYEELRDHYRASLEERIETIGLDRAKIHVLEALLRLRQAACHPGLVDEARRSGTSAKLEALVENVREVIAGGHKALVFSQFVSFLEIVKKRLDKEGITYEYLDGKTRDRKARIQRFQEDPKCELFLISLKAGGLGLNLTAADYVFILDPWWNPAVEAQAIDRVHRIGQIRAVFAYRIIARGTVEEKILQLQSEKRNLAQALISEDNSVLSKMTLEDLELLLG